MIHNSGFVPSFHFENVWAIKELYSRMGLKIHLRKLWEDRFRPKNKLCNEFITIFQLN